MNLKTTTLAAALCLAFTPALHAAGDASGSMMKSGSSSSMAGGSSMGSPDQETVRKVQQQLADKGHNPGMVDGMMGQQTKQALMEYQQAEGMPATGKLDAQTRESLGVADAGSTMAGGASTTNPKATSPNRSGSGSPAGNDKPTSPTPDVKRDPSAGSMSSGSGGSMSEGSMSGSAGGGSDTKVSPNRSGSGAPSGNDKPTAPTTR